jgi:hypothetical protein
VQRRRDHWTRRETVAGKRPGIGEDIAAGTRRRGEAGQRESVEAAPMHQELSAMRTVSHSDSPTVLLRVSDGTFHMHRSFTDFGQATRSAEAYAGAGFHVSMISATGRFLMGFEPRRQRIAV